MSAILSVVHIVLLVFLIVLFTRMVVDYIRMFSRSWRPSGPVAMGVELVYTMTDPPLRMLRKIIPPIPLGGIKLDLGFMVLVFVVYLLFTFTGQPA